MKPKVPLLPHPSATSTTVAVVGAGMAGAACAAGLRAAGMTVTVFEAAATPGGRLAGRTVAWSSPAGAAESAWFELGVQRFSAQRPRFRAFLASAYTAGQVDRWSAKVHASSLPRSGDISYVGVPDMAALCRYQLRGMEVRCGRRVECLQRRGRRWVIASGGGSDGESFDHVMLATLPVSAAVLSAGHRDEWADTLARACIEPCWTLLAVSDDTDWPWDAAQPGRGPLAEVTRCDRRPGHRTAPRVPGRALWAARATAQWSRDHLELDAGEAAAALRRALSRLLPCRSAPAWHCCSAHRWRFALAGAPVSGGECWWDPELGLGVCGDYFGDGTVEAAWRSGDELADTVAADLELHPRTRVAGREAAARDDAGDVGNAVEVSDTVG